MLSAAHALPSARQGGAAPVPVLLVTVLLPPEPGPMLVVVLVAKPPAPPMPPGPVVLTVMPPDPPVLVDVPWPLEVLVLPALTPKSERPPQVAAARTNVLAKNARSSIRCRRILQDKTLETASLSHG
jgi:hypothetical protein